MSTIEGLAFWAALIAAYWLPTIIATCRNLPRLGQIIIINGLTGWTLIGWIIAIVMAAEPSRLRDASTNDRPGLIRKPPPGTA